MRWPWRQRNPADSGHGRDRTGRLYDGDTVRPEGWRGWAGLLPSQPTDALTEPTQQVPTVEAPLMTPAQQWRSRGGRR